MSENKLIDKMSLVDIQYVENARYEQRNKDEKHIIDFSWKKRFVAAIALIAMLGGSSVYCHANGINLLDYLRKQPLYSWFFTNDVDENINQVQEGAAYEGNQEISYDKYKIRFVNWFSENTTGNVLATFLITDKNGEVLSDAMFEEFDHLLHSKLCLSPTVEMNAYMDEVLCRDENNNAIMTYRIVQQVRNRQSIDTLQLEEFEAEKSPVIIGKFQIPKKVQELKSIELDVSQSALVKKVLISGMAIQMTFDDAYANEQFEKQLKDSGEWDKPDFDLEAHGYDFYNKELVLVMKDGTKHIIWNWDVNDDGFVANSFGTGNDGTGLVDEVFGFAEFIDVDEIDYLQMDDEVFQVK